jgi:predicted nuclease of predicted toxin-antitoxin system
MHFLLDNDVDVEVGRMLVRHRQTYCTASDVGLTDAADPDYAVLAAERGWVLITHDREFSTWRRKRTFGHHIHLACEEPDGPDILEEALDRVVAVLEHLPDAWIRVSRNAMKVDSKWT